MEGKQIRLHVQGSGFSVIDAARKERIALGRGAVKQSGDRTSYGCEKPGDFRLAAEFVDKGRYVLVSGHVENLKANDRGIVLSYRIALPGDDVWFGNELNDPVKVGDCETEGSVYPVASLCGAEVGVAMAIPPWSPCEFGMAAGSQGLTTRLYLGTSAATENFPNRAAFAFVVYPVDAQWGFRSAISKYYDFFPDYYQVRTKSDGLSLQQMPPGLDLDDIQYFGIDWIGFGKRPPSTISNETSAMASCRIP